MKKTILAVTLLAGSAHAFCGFYVAGGGAELFNNATQVVLMREGTRTVLSMQSPVYGRWGGPPANQVAEGTKAAKDTAFVARDPSKVEKLAESSIAELQVKGLKGEAGKPLRKKK